MAKNSNEQLQSEFNSGTQKLIQVEKAFSKQVDAKAVKLLVKTQQEVTDEIETSVRALELQTDSYKKQNNLVEALRAKAQILTGEEKAQVELKLKQAEANRDAISNLMAMAEAKKANYEQTAAELSVIQKQNPQIKSMVDAYKEKEKAEERAVALKEREEELANNITNAAKEYEYYSLDTYNKLSKEIKEQTDSVEKLKKEYAEMSPGEKRSKKGRALDAQIKGLEASTNTKQEQQKDVFSNLSIKDKKEVSSSQTEKLSEGIGEMKDALKTGFKDTISSWSNIGNAIVSAVNMSRNFFNNIVDGAVSSVEKYYGPIAASLEGVNGAVKDFRSLNSRVQLDVGLSSMIKQEDLLGSINDLVKQGITSDVESLGILSLLKDKTVSSFNATDENLRRLVRLNQQKGNLTAKQFGLADALKESFNNTFGDHTFLNSMYQSLTGAVLDAVSSQANSGGTDSTAFYSVLESWLGAMYESGVGSDTINTIAKGINYLGSGNVSALSSDKTLQNLILLSMDRAGLDYAEVLQQGLSNSDMNKLLSTIVDYLADITSTTKENNVLQSSYANLFNMSITDMTAIQNLSKSGFSAIAMTGEGAQNKALSEINQVSSRTAASEQINNVLANAQYSFGSSIAANKIAYYTYKTSNMILDTLDSLGNTALGSNGGMLAKAAGKVFDVVSGPTRLVASIAYLSSLLPGVVGFGKSLVGSASSLLNGDKNNALAEVIAQGSSGGLFDGGSGVSGAASLSLSTGGKSNSKLKQFSLESSAKSSGITDTSSWQNDAEAASEEDDETTKILKEFEKTLMKAKDKEGYAIAVSLQGMSDGVLKSFASIFADEEAMMNTMTGQNNALEKNNTFIDYLEDSSKTTGSATSNASAATANAKTAAKKV